MFKKILDISAYLNLKEVGLLELTFALTPMLSGFSLGKIPLSALMWLILIMITVNRKGGGKMRNFKPLTIFVVYWLLHTLAIMLVDEYNINAFIVQFIYFAAVYLLYPILDSQKLRGSLNWVALISIAGLLYQWTIIITGRGVHPLEIPGLSMSEGRLEQLILRPSSFFMEPAAYVSFMMCPLALSMMDRKWSWSATLILSIFLTTSTTGLVLSFLLMGMTLFGNRLRKGTMVAVVVLAGAMFYSLTHFDAFNAGVEKFENTNTETNVRLSQGIYVVSTMEPAEFIFGAPYSSTYSYCKSGRAPNVVYYGESVFMPTFWLMILCYGIAGLLLYLNIYWKIYKTSKKTMPYIVCLIAVMFSSGYCIEGLYIFTLIFLLVIARSDKPLMLKQKRIR